jgi:phage-related protein (TIGR01555 family)
MKKKTKARVTVKDRAPVKVQVGKGKTTVPKQRMSIGQMTEVFKDKVFDNKTVDGFDNFVSKLGLNNDNALSAGTYEFNLITRNRILLEAAYRGSWIVGAIVDSVAEDMTRAGIAITTNEGKENLQELKNAMSRLQISQSLCTLVKWGRLYGGALGILQIQGQDLSTPLNLDRVAKGQFQGIVVFDRWQLNPRLDHLIDAGPEMGLPKYYDIVNDPRATGGDFKTATGQLKVHHSRVIRMAGIDLPYFQAITEMMWGESNLERLWDRLIAFDNASMSAASLIDRASLRTVGVQDLREIVAAGGEAQMGLIAQFEMMRSLQVNEGLTLIDKNDSFESTAYSFAGLSDMLLQFYQQLSGAASIPLIRLLGQSPAGLNGGGEDDIRMYYDNVNAQQEAKLRNGWELVIKVLWRSTFGQPSPKDMQFQFVPLWQMTATEKATNAKTIAETVIGAQEAGLTSKKSALMDLRGTSPETGLFSNITEEDIKEAEEQDENPPNPNEVDISKPEEAAASTPPDDKKISRPVPSLNAAPEKKSAFKRIKSWLGGGKDAAV